MKLSIDTCIPMY